MEFNLKGTTTKKFGIEYETRYIVNDNAVICFVEAFPSKNTVAYLNTLGLSGGEGWETKGVALLKAGDTNDIELAKRIAEKKALRSAYKAFAQSFKSEAEESYKKVDALIGLAISASERAESCDNRITKLIG